MQGNAHLIHLWNFVVACAGEVKVVVVGNGNVGKTSLIRQFCKGQYCNNYKKTIGVDFLEKHQ